LSSFELLASSIDTSFYAYKLVSSFTTHKKALPDIQEGQDAGAR